MDNYSQELPETRDIRCLFIICSLQI